MGATRFEVPSPTYCAYLCYEIGANLIHSYGDEKASVFTGEIVEVGCSAARTVTDTNAADLIECDLMESLSWAPA